MCFRGAWANGYMVIAKSLRRSVIIAPGLKQISDLDFLQWDGKEKDFFG